MSCLRECHAINSYYEYSSINVRNFNCKGRLMTIYSQIYFLEYTEYYHATKINPFQFFSTNDIFTCITVCKSSCNRLIIGKLKQKRPTAFGYSFKLWTKLAFKIPPCMLCFNKIQKYFLEPDSVSMISAFNFSLKIV